MSEHDRKGGDPVLKEKVEAAFNVLLENADGHYINSSAVVGLGTKQV